MSSVTTEKETALKKAQDLESELKALKDAPPPAPVTVNGVEKPDAVEKPAEAVSAAA